ncbi:hypothetical protein Pan216_45070 [Planctomycetes bacterium Pan216]|uniref:Uncharacterized protein n=1 Tax=Kolteria novifilia TaxID=2527975 RepID=A0A518B9H0_9BACT|nr:hypothetical protein Pan216_45070 [Planctomycetes bacterium Pan216]
MRLYAALVVSISLLVGCLHDPSQIVSNGSWSRFKPKMPDVMPDVVELRYLFIERELGDKVIDEAVWAEADEHALPIEKKVMLNKNGLRIAKLGSRLPADLLKLLDDREGSNDGRRHWTHSGQLVKIQTTPIVPSWTVLTVQGGQATGEDLSNAQGYLYITPSHGDGSNVVVKMVPVVEYGSRQQKRMPAPDLSGWQLRHERDNKIYNEMAVDLDLMSGEYAILGCVAEQTGTLGHRFFVRTVEEKQFQTVVLIRVVRPTREELRQAGYDVDDFFLSDAPKSNGSRPRNTAFTPMAN